MNVWLTLLLTGFVGVGRLLPAVAQTLTSSNLPIVVISTPNASPIPDEPGIVADFSIYDKAGSAVLNNLVTDTPTYSGKIDIEIRGNSTQFFPKKSFGFETKDSTGLNDFKVSLFGMPAEEDWILNASYGDKTFVRDMTTHYIAGRMGMYSSRTKPVEVIVNGVYQGIYIAMEKIKRGADRVDISNLKPTDLSGNNLTGGYILKVDANVGGSSPGWTSPYPALGQPGDNPQFLIEYPKASDLQPAQAQYIQTYVTAFENALAGPSFKDPLTGYRKYLDVDRMVDYFLIQEVTKNIDAWRLSTYMYKDKVTKAGGLLKMGPAWDFDRAYGNIQWCYPSSVLPTGNWTWEYNLNCPSRPPLTLFWPKRLLEDCSFVEKLRTRYQTLRQSFLKTDSLLTFIDARISPLRQGSPTALDRNFEKWPILTTEIFYNEVYGNVSFEGEVTDLKDWLTEHLAWMDANISRIGQAPLPTATLAGSATINAGESSLLSLTFTGSGPWRYTLSDGRTGTTADSLVSLSVSPTQTTVYTLASVANGCGTGTTTGSAVVTVQPAGQADVSLTMQMASRTVALNSPVSLSILVGNGGSQPARGIQVEDQLPANRKFARSAQPEVTHSAGIVRIQARDLMPGETAVYAFLVQPTRPGQYQNAAQIVSLGQPDTDSQPGSGTGDGQDDCARVDWRTLETDATVFQSANPGQVPLPALQPNQPAPDPDRVDLDLALSVSNRIPTLSDSVALVVEVSNRGGRTATGAVVSLRLPDGVTAAPGDGLTQTNDLVTLLLPDVAVNDRIVRRLSIRWSQKAGLFASTPMISQCNQTDSDSTPGTGALTGEDDEAQIEWRVR